MTLAFPSLARRYDRAAQAVFFNAAQGRETIAFGIEAGALDPAWQDGDGETDLLARFDARLPEIRSAAREVHFNERKSLYILTPGDLV